MYSLRLLIVIYFLLHTLQTYVRMKKRAAAEVGIISFDAELSENVSQQEVCLMVIRVIY